MIDDRMSWGCSVPQSVFEAIGHLKNLKYLNLDLSSIPDITFLRQLTELQRLILYTTSDINIIARFNQKLTALSIFSVKGSLDAGLEFSELIELHLGVVDSSNYLELIRSSPKVEKIVLKLAASIDDDDGYGDSIRAVLQQPTVRQLELYYCGDGGNIRPLEKAFDMISSNYGNLRGLSIVAKVGPAWKSAEFLLPEKREEWNVEEQEKRLIDFLQ